MDTSKPARQRDTEDRRREGITSEVEGFNERGRRAIADRELHDAVALATEKFVTGRNAALMFAGADLRRAPVEFFREGAEPEARTWLTS